MDIEKEIQFLFWNWVFRPSLFQNTGPEPTFLKSESESDLFTDPDPTKAPGSTSPWLGGLPPSLTVNASTEFGPATQPLNTYIKRSSDGLFSNGAAVTKTHYIRN